MNQNLNIPGANPINPNIPPLTSLQIPPPNLLLNPEVLAEGGLPPFTQPPPPFFEPGAPAIFPDFSKPPPGFPVPAFAPPVIEEIVPTIPYYDLPAGLMVPLVKVKPSNKNENPKLIIFLFDSWRIHRIVHLIQMQYGYHHQHLQMKGY